MTTVWGPPPFVPRETALPEAVDVAVVGAGCAGLSVAADLLAAAPGLRVAVLEAGHLAGGTAAYLGALAGYATGTVDGVGLWLRHCAEAVVSGVVEGERVCLAVRVGRLG